MRKFLSSALLWIRGIFFIMTKIPYLLVLIVLGAFAFVLNDQGTDLMIAFGTMDLFSAYILAFFALLITWSSVLWYVGRTTLTSANLSRIIKEPTSLSNALENPDCAKDCKLKKDHRVVLLDVGYKWTIQKLAKWVPRILALIPYFIFIWGYTRANGWNNSGMIKLLIIAVIAVAHIVYLSYRNDIFRRKKSNAVKPDPKAELDQRFFLDEVKDPKEVIRSQNLKRTTVAIFIVFVFCFVYALYYGKATPSLNGKPGLIILCGMIFYSLLGMFIIYISNRLKFPFFTFLLIIVLLISLPRNNNHAIEKISDISQYSQINNRLTDSIYFKEWLNYKISREQLYTKDSVTPIFLISAEGGGIRACYWTSQVLKTLHIQHPEIFRNTFVVTGASGGTVGLSFFYNYIFEKSKGDYRALASPAFYASLDTITGSDFLSGVTYGFLFPDLAQRLIPWPIASFDRAKFLSNGFSQSFAKHTVSDAGASTLLDRSMLAPWQPQTNPYDRPVILFNSLYVEEGQKAIFSPYKLTKRYYEDALDILGATQTLVPMKEAMLSSARFPAITPPGLMMERKENGFEKYGHLVDGGYFENTAVQTAQQTVMMMKSVIRQMNLPGKKFVPVIIALKYGSDTSIHKSPLGGGYEAAPVIGGINTLFRWINGANAMSVKLDSDMSSINFKLINYRGDRIPLGWYLSPGARQLVENYAKQESPVFKKPYGALKKYLN